MKFSLEPLVQIQNNFTELFLIMPLNNNRANGSTPLNKRAARAPDKNLFFKFCPWGQPPPPHMKIKLVLSEYGHVAFQIKAAYNNILANVLLLHLHSKG